MFNYWSELAAAQRPDDPCEIRCPLSRSQWRGRRAGRIERALNRLVFYPRAVRRLRATGVVHVLDHSAAYLLDAVPARCRTVVTVHDLIPLVDADGLTERQVERYRSVVLRLKNADRLVAVSNYTRGEIVRLLDIDESRIVVVPNGVCHDREGTSNWSGGQRIDASTRRTRTTPSETPSSRAQCKPQTLGSTPPRLPKEPPNPDRPRSLA